MTSGRKRPYLRGSVEETDELLERLAIQREADEKAVKQYADARQRLGAVPLSSVQAAR